MTQPTMPRAPCSACGHVHQGAGLGFICIGCAREERPESEAADAKSETKSESGTSTEDHAPEAGVVATLERIEKELATLARAVYALCDRLAPGFHPESPVRTGTAAKAKRKRAPGAVAKKPKARGKRR